MTAENKLLDGRYQIERELGAGTFGCVYQAFDHELNRQVAIKILNTWMISDESSDIFKRFLREAQALSRLSHPNIVKVFSFGRTEDQQPYLAMEFLAGESLARVLSDNENLPFDEAIIILRQVCDGLSFAHQNNILHRDLKPANILICSDATENKKICKLVDFGLARETSAGAATITGTGELIGTPDYMSPEQCLGRQVDERSDIYSLGCLFYEMLMGEPPFAGENSIAKLGRHISETPLMPSLINSRIKMPQELERILTKCLEKKPDNRFQSVDELNEALSYIKLSDCKAKLSPAMLKDARRNGHKLTIKMGRVPGFSERLSIIVASGLLSVLAATLICTDPGRKALGSVLVVESLNLLNIENLRLYGSFLYGENRELAPQFTQTLLQSQAFKGRAASERRDLAMTWLQTNLLHGDEQSATVVSLYLLRLCVEECKAAYQEGSSVDENWQRALRTCTEYLTFANLQATDVRMITMIMATRVRNRDLIFSNKNVPGGKMEVTTVTEASSNSLLLTVESFDHIWTWRLRLRALLFGNRDLSGEDTLKVVRCYARLVTFFSAIPNSPMPEYYAKVGLEYAEKHSGHHDLPKDWDYHKQLLVDALRKIRS